MSTLQIEMIHDVVCSWCPIGYRNITAALQQLSLDANVTFLPFELNPDLPAQGEEINQHLAQRNGWNQQQLQAYRQQLITKAQQAGLNYDFNQRTHYYNSHKAHRLIHWAHSFNRQAALNEALITAYFTHGVDISDDFALLKIVAQLGLDTKQASAVLSAKQDAPGLLQKYQTVAQLAVGSVPAFRINGDYLAGSNSVEFFINYLSNLIPNPAKCSA